MNDRQRLEAIVAVVLRYLPPDGISREQAMNEIIELVDPLPQQSEEEKMNTQLEALRLAEILDSYALGDEYQRVTEDAAAELRRLHEVNQELVFALRYIEAQTHLGHIHDTASSALAKARGKNEIQKETSSD